jgi:hypothetical protein
MEVYMSKMLYLTGGNTDDKSTRQITYNEAEKMFLDAQNMEKIFEPICSIVEYGEKGIYRKVIYFTFQVVIIDLHTTKQVWYEKIKDNRYFIDKIVYNNYKKQGIYVEMHIRNSTFSYPNICMIKVCEQNEWKYFVGDIDDTLFYRMIHFGDVETLYKDLDASFEPYLNNIQKCNEKFISDDLSNN